MYIIVVGPLSLPSLLISGKYVLVLCFVFEPLSFGDVVVERLVLIGSTCWIHCFCVIELLVHALSLYGSLLHCLNQFVNNG